MKKLIAIEKPIGWTPLHVIEKLKKQFPEYKDESLSYAGRLDPLAHGVLLLMVGDATKEREQYLAYPKTYEFDVLFGIETDTYDLLGIPKINPSPFKGEGLGEGTKIIASFIQSHLGKQTQSYPPYSSKAVNGKPLFQWAKDNKLNEITIPEKEIEITSFKQMNSGTITKEQLQIRVDEAIQTVSGDFRQDEIKKAWKTLLDQETEETFVTARFRIECSSGTYVRALVHKLGKATKTSAVTLDILRTKVGEYTLEETMKIN